MTPETDRLLHYMPIIVRAPDITDWERRFCASILGAAKRRAFVPSPRQIATMGRIVAAFQNTAMRRDGDLIERGS